MKALGLPQRADRCAKVGAKLVLVLVLSLSGLYWTLTPPPDGLGCELADAAVPAALVRGTPEQEAAYAGALGAIAAYRQKTDDYGCPDGAMVTAGFGGRLGSAMAEYATLWAYARRFRLRAWLLPAAYDQLSVRLDVSLPPLPIHCEARFLQCTMRRDNCLRLREKARRNVWIERFANEVTLFDAYRLEVRRELQLPAAARAAAALRLDCLRRRLGRPNATMVGVHVRRTDYAGWLERHVGGRLVGPDYFRRAMEHFRRRHPGSVFAVVSDDMPWCSEHLGAADAALVGDGDTDYPLPDMALLAACDHSVLSYGTFGFFAAYLAGGELVVPVNFTQVELPLTEQLRRVSGLSVTFIDMMQMVP